MGRLIYKILLREEWAAAETGAAIMSEVDRKDGYVHFSTASQVQETLSKWFKGKTGCVLAAYDADDFAPDLKWEKARGDQLFPHVYAEVRADKVKTLWLLEQGEDGAPLAPDEVSRLKDTVTSQPPKPDEVQ